MDDHTPTRTSGPNPPEAGAVVVYSNIACPDADVVIDALLAAREEHGLNIALAIDHRPLPAESIPDHETSDGAPVPTRAAHEAVQAAKAQGPEAAVRFDRALRRAHRHDGGASDFDLRDPDTIADTAAAEGLDRDELTAELDSGRPGADVRHHLAEAVAAGITTSPTIVAPDGSIVENPAPAVVEEIVLRAGTGVAAE